MLEVRLEEGKKPLSLSRFVVVLSVFFFAREERREIASPSLEMVGPAAVWLGNDK